MEHPLFSFAPAAGWAKTPDQVRLLARCRVITDIVVGSFTIEKREGNTGGTPFATLSDGTGGNSRGMDNCGIKMLRVFLPEMVEIAQRCGKRLIVSIAGFNPKEYALLAKEVAESGADGMEANVGCPNIWDGGSQKAIVSYEPTALREVLSSIITQRQGCPVSVKLSPYADPDARKGAAAVIGEFADDIEAVVTCNTFPNMLLVNDEGHPLITVSNGIGGMSGTALRPIAYSEAYHLRQLLPEMRIVSVGGISSGTHVMERLKLGCSGVQIGTAFFDGERLGVFPDVLAQFAELPGAEQYLPALDSDTWPA